MSNNYDGPLAEGRTYLAKFASYPDGRVKIKKIRGWMITYMLYDREGIFIRASQVSEIWLRENLVKEIVL